MRRVWSECWSERSQCVDVAFNGWQLSTFVRQAAFAALPAGAGAVKSDAPGRRLRPEAGAPSLADEKKSAVGRRSRPERNWTNQVSSCLDKRDETA